jgi:hypothetical protein
LAAVGGQHPPGKKGTTMELVVLAIASQAMITQPSTTPSTSERPASAATRLAMPDAAPSSFSNQPFGFLGHKPRNDD